jgi:hypothetical protein
VRQGSAAPGYRRLDAPRTYVKLPPCRKPAFRATDVSAQLYRFALIDI